MSLLNLGKILKPRQDLGRGLLIEPARSSKRRKKFERARAKVHKKYGGAFKRLAE